MIRPANGKILVRVNLKQKEEMTIGGVTVRTASLFEKNYREKSPVVCAVVHGNTYVKEGDILLAHHNSFYLPSPYHLQDDLFSIPFGKTLFAVVDKDGVIKPICDNILCDRVVIETFLPLPPELQKTYIDRVVVKDGTGTPYKKGETVFHRPNAGYDIVYIWQGIEKRVTKVAGDQVCGVLK